MQRNLSKIRKGVALQAGLRFGLGKVKIWEVEFFASSAVYLPANLAFDGLLNSMMLTSIIESRDSNHRVEHLHEFATISK